MNNGIFGIFGKLTPRRFQWRVAYNQIQTLPISQIFFEVLSQGKTFLIRHFVTSNVSKAYRSIYSTFKYVKISVIGSFWAKKGPNFIGGVAYPYQNQ